jgi:hypothetical protein
LTTEDFHAQAFAVRFPAVAGTTSSFFVCHFRL